MSDRIGLLGDRVIAALLPSAFCLLPFAFCLLPSAFCLLPNNFSTFRLFDFPTFRISVSSAARRLNPQAISGAQLKLDLPRQRLFLAVTDQRVATHAAWSASGRPVRGPAAAI